MTQRHFWMAIAACVVLVTTLSAQVVHAQEKQKPPDKVTIIGEVEKPGSYEMKDSDKRRVLDWLLEAGVKKTADLSRIQLIRGKETRILNLKQLGVEGKVADNIALLPGDVIFVPTLKPIRVVGAVQKPGVFYTSNEKASVVEVLDEAGGFLPNADLSKAQIIRESGKVVTVNLEGKFDVDLRPGDLLFIPIGTGINVSDSLYVTVYGAVKQRGVIKLTEPTPLLNLLQDVGAIDNENADLKNVEVTSRDGTKKVVDIDKLLREADEKEDLILKGGERIYVPRLPPIKNSIYVTGGVARPGIYRYEKDMTLFQAILMAGGAARYSKKEVSILRMNPETKKVEQLTFDFQKIKKGEAEDPQLQPGDVIYVGEGKVPPSFGHGERYPPPWFYYILWGWG